MLPCRWIFLKIDWIHHWFQHTQFTCKGNGYFESFISKWAQCHVAVVAVYVLLPLTYWCSNTQQEMACMTTCTNIGLKLVYFNDMYTELLYIEWPAAAWINHCFTCCMSILSCTSIFTSYISNYWSHIMTDLWNFYKYLIHYYFKKY